MTKYVNTDTGEILNTLGERSYIMDKSEVNRYPTGSRLRNKWRSRLLCEAKKSPYLFITLTYENAPELPSKDDIQGFFKRLRRYCDYHNLECFKRYYVVYEYGDIHERLHYHGLLFGVQWSWQIVEAIAKCWSLGRTQVRQGSTKFINYTIKYLHKADVDKCGWRSMQSRGLGSDYIKSLLPVVKANNNRNVRINGYPVLLDNYYVKKYIDNDDLCKKITENSLRPFHKKLANVLQHYSRNKLYIVDDCNVHGLSFVPVNEVQSELKDVSIFKYVNK